MSDLLIGVISFFTLVTIYAVWDRHCQMKERIANTQRINQVLYDQVKREREQTEQALRNETS